MLWSLPITWLYETQGQLQHNSYPHNDVSIRRNFIWDYAT